MRLLKRVTLFIILIEINAVADVKKDSAVAKKDKAEKNKIIWQDACSMNIEEDEPGYACYLGGYLEKDKNKAHDFFKKSCDLEFARGCAELANIEKDRGNTEQVAKLYKLANKYYINSEKKEAKPKCDKNDSDACYDLGYAEQRSGNKDQAAEFYEKACKLNHFEACFRLGEIEEESYDDIVKATTHYKKACNNGYIYACVSLGSLEEKKGNTEIALKLYEKACNKIGVEKSKSNGIGRGCIEAGMLKYKTGKKKEGRAILNKECDKGYALACELLISSPQ